MSSGDPVIDEFADPYAHGIRTKNPAQYYEVKCTRCHKTVGWSPYYPRDLLYCIECYELIGSHMKDKSKKLKKK